MLKFIKNTNKKVKELQKNEKAKANFKSIKKVISFPFKTICFFAKVPMFIGGFIFLFLAFKVITFNPTTELPALEQEYQQMVEPAQSAVENSEVESTLPNTNYNNAADAFNAARNSDARKLDAQIQFAEFVDRVKN